MPKPMPKTRSKVQPIAKQEETPKTGTLNVVGFGEVHIKPDVAWIHLGVTTRGETAEHAVRANAQQLAEVIERIKALGIAEESINSGGAVIFPILHTEDGPKKGQVLGYGAENHVTIRTDVEQAGKVFDEGRSAGANQSSSVSFGLRDEGPMRKLALDVAIRSAYSEAQLVAESVGVRLQGPRSMDVERGGGTLVLGRTSEAGGAPSPSLPGKLTLSAKVRIVYDYLHAGS